MLFREAAEERLTGEAQLVAYLLDALVGLFELIFHVLGHVVGDDVGGGAAAYALADGREILGRDVEAVGIVLHVARLGIGRREHGDEGAEVPFGARAGGLGRGDEAFEQVVEVVEKCLQQSIRQFALKAARPVGEARKDELVVEAEGAYLVGAQGEEGRAVSEEKEIPRGDASRYGDTLHEIAREADAAEVEVGAAPGAFDEYVGVADDEIAGSDVERAVVERHGGASAHAEQHEKHVDAHGPRLRQVVQVFDEGDAVVAIGGGARSPQGVKAGGSVFGFHCAVSVFVCKYSLRGGNPGGFQYIKIVTGCIKRHTPTDGRGVPCGQRAPSGGLFQAVGEEQQAIQHVDVAHAAVEVERKEVDVGVQLLDAFFNALGHDVVGNAAEGLQAHDVVDALARQREHLGRQQPALAKLGVERDDAPGLGGLGIYVVEGREARVAPARAVVALHLLPHEAVEPAHKGDGPAAPREAAAAVHLEVDEGLQEKVGEQRRHHLDAVLREPAADVFLGKGVELQENFAHHAHPRRGAAGGGGGKVGGGAFEQLGQAARLVAHDGPGRLGQVAVFEAPGQAGLALAHGGGIIELGYAVAKEQGPQHGGYEPEPVDAEAGLLVAKGLAKGDRHDGHPAVARLGERTLDEFDVVRRATLATRLRDGHGRRRRVVASRLKGLDDVAHDERGGVAHLVVGVAQAPFGRLRVAGRQVVDVVARQAHEGGHEGREEGGEERGHNFAPAVGTAEGRRRGKGSDGGLRAVGQGQAQALHGRAHTQADGARVAHVVDFQQGHRLAVAGQELARLVGEEGVGAAAERRHLHALHVGPLQGHPLGCPQDAVGIGPLRDVVGVVGADVFGPHQVVGDDVDAQPRHHLGQSVLDEGVGVVGAAGQQHRELAPAAALAQDGAVGLGQGVAEASVFVQGGTEGRFHLGGRHAQPREVRAALAVEQAAVFEGDDGRVDGHVAALHAAHHLRIARHDGAVVAVGAALGFFVDNKGHEHAVDAALGQVADVAVHEFGREADVVRHDEAGRGFVGRHRRGTGEDNAQAAAREQRVPEGVFLVHVEAARNAHDGARTGHVGRAVEEQVQLFVVGVAARAVLAPLVAEHFFAAVAGVVAVAPGKAIDGDGAAVFAAVALALHALASRAGREVARPHPFPRKAAGMERAAHGTHQFGPAAARHLAAREALEGPNHRVVLHRSALHDDVGAQLVGVFQAQHLVEAVFDHRIRQPGRYVAQRGPFAQRLLHLGVHKHGAARAQVVGPAGQAGLAGKGGRIVAQRAGKRFDEGAAAR